MPKPGDVYNPRTDSFGPPPMASPYSPEGIAQRQQAKAVQELRVMQENRNRIPLKSVLIGTLALAAGGVIVGAGLYLLEQLGRLP